MGGKRVRCWLSASFSLPNEVYAVENESANEGAGDLAYTGGFLLSTNDSGLDEIGAGISRGGNSGIEGNSWAMFMKRD